MEKHGGMSTRENLIRPPELSGNPTNSHLETNEEELDEGNDEFGLVSLFISQSDLL
jgi:hypothetical protein